MGIPGRNKITGDNSTVPWAFSLWALFKSQLREAGPHPRVEAETDQISEWQAGQGFVGQGTGEEDAQKRATSIRIGRLLDLGQLLNKA